MNVHRFWKIVPLALAVVAGAIVPAHAAPRQEKAVLAGGCFWGVEAVFEQLRGVSNVVSGFSGGNKATAHYEVVSTGMTGHAESVEITYDPSQISYRQLLDVYFTVAHDPTELDYQGSQTNRPTLPSRCRRTAQANDSHAITVLLTK